MSCNNNDKRFHLYRPNNCLFEQDIELLLLNQHSTDSHSDSGQGTSQMLNDHLRYLQAKHSRPKPMSFLDNCI